MSSSSGYSLEDVKNDLDVLRAVDNKVVEAIEGAASQNVLEYLIREQQLDLHHEGNQGVGKIRRAVLESSRASQDLKRTVITRGDDTPATVLVPDDVERNAMTALRTGKPVVLYGPTGTGKTTFAKARTQTLRWLFTSYSNPLMDGEGHHWGNRGEPFRIDWLPVVEL